MDELTHFTWDEYSYVMSRNRPSGPGTRVYIRATANPGGVGHGWVKARFISPAPAGTRIVQLVKVKAPGGGEITRRSSPRWGRSSSPAAHPHFYPVHRL